MTSTVADFIREWIDYRGDVMGYRLSSWPKISASG
jgi:hypothetical protein